MLIYIENHQWRWRNETGTFHIHGPGVCSASRTAHPYSLFELLCFMKGDSSNDDIINVVYFSANSTMPGNLTIDAIAASPLTGSGPDRFGLNTKTSSDISFLPDEQKEQIVWLNQSRLDPYDISGRRGQSPKNRFPYPHFASTWATNSTNSYVYHQLNDTVIAGELWDGGESDFWISKNITID